MLVDLSESQSPKRRSGVFDHTAITDLLYRAI